MHPLCLPHVLSGLWSPPCRVWNSSTSSTTWLNWSSVSKPEAGIIHFKGSGNLWTTESGESACEGLLTEFLVINTRSFFQMSGWLSICKQVSHLSLLLRDHHVPWRSACPWQLITLTVAACYGPLWINHMHVCYHGFSSLCIYPVDDPSWHPVPVGLPSLGPFQGVKLCNTIAAILYIQRAVFGGSCCPSLARPHLSAGPRLLCRSSPGFGQCNSAPLMWRTPWHGPAALGILKDQYLYQGPLIIQIQPDGPWANPQWLHSVQYCARMYT